MGKEEDLLNAQSLHCYILKGCLIDEEEIMLLQRVWNTPARVGTTHLRLTETAKKERTIQELLTQAPNVNIYYNGTTYTTLLTTFSQFLCLVMFLLYSTVSPNLNEGRKRGLTMGLGWTHSRGVGSTLFGSPLSRHPHPCLTVRCFNWCSSQTHRPEKAPTTPTHAQRQPAAGAAKGRKSCASSRLRGRAAHCAYDLIVSPEAATIHRILCHVQREETLKTKMCRILFITMPWFHLFRPAVKITEQKKVKKKYLRDKNTKKRRKMKNQCIFSPGKDKNIS